MSKTKIEWCEKVWSPVTGCTPVSEGCRNCYAKRMAQRLKGRYGYPSDDPFRVTYHPDRLEEPFRWKKPCRIFVCSMGDLFHEDVYDGNINRVMIRIARAHWHTFLILTKRPERLREVFSRYSYAAFENLWLGVSVENQATADERIPLLLQTPAAIRFVSYEPALESIDFSSFFDFKDYHEHNPKKFWLIMGGESGPGARPMQPEWARDTRDQCQAAGVPFFFKQWGTNHKEKGWNKPYTELEKYRHAGYNVEAKKGGRILDGRTWDEYPENI